MIVDLVSGGGCAAASLWRFVRCVCVCVCVYVCVYVGQLRCKKSWISVF
jgi:hypothetical protein